jgi:hypothetical protein
LCRDSAFSLEISTAQPALADRFLREVLLWHAVGPGRFQAPADAEPLFELADGEGPAALYALHFEVDDLEAAEARARWMEVVAQREERPPGRHIVGLRWRTWPFHIGLYQVGPSYWAWPPRQRVVAIARCPDLEGAREALTTTGWASVHEWQAGGRRGCYLKPRSPRRIDVSIHPGAERLAVAALPPIG